MNVYGILPFARLLLANAAHEGDTVVDATVGNGHDTVYLAELVGPSGSVYGFDIQKTALDATRDRLQQKGLQERVALIHDGHEQLGSYIPQERTIHAAVFNLGYLPGHDKAIITGPKTTITAVEELMIRLKKGGIIVLVVYHGHPGGDTERDQLRDFTRSLPQEKWHVLEYGFTNQKNHPPFLIGIEKK